MQVDCANINGDVATGTMTKRALTLSSVSVFLVFNLFLLGPFEVCRGNLTEFDIAFTAIVKNFLIPAGIVFTLILAADLFLPDNAHRRYASILFIFGLLTWLQGNILVWKYGVLDGHAIDWTQNMWRGWVDALIWVSLLILAIIYYPLVYKTALAASIVFVFLQSVYLVFLSIQTPEILKDKRLAATMAPPDGIYEFSSKQNVIHIVLDALQTDVFQEIIDQQADHYYPVLEGFTFFRETTGSFRLTLMSIPAILSGQNYKNDITIPQFLDRVMKGKTIPNVLYERGYEVDLVVIDDRYTVGKNTNSYKIPVPYGVTKAEHLHAMSAFILDLVLFRCAPHFLKRFIYNNQQWLFQTFVNNNVQKKPYIAELYLSHKSFLQDLIENISIKRNKPVYKFIHLTTTHGPPVVNNDCEYLGKVLPWSRADMIIQNRCSLEHLIEFLEKLKSIGIYDSSLIIINADHGFGSRVKMKNIGQNFEEDFISNREIVGYALTTLAVKPPFSKGPLKMSNAQTSLTDIPSTIASILKLNEQFNGRSIYDIDPSEVRERKFWYFTYGHQMSRDYYNFLDEFIIKGSAFDRASWRRSGLSYHSPQSSYKTAKIDFGTRQASRFLRSGWSLIEKNPAAEYTFSWISRQSASIFISLPRDKPILLTANLKSKAFPGPQHITIKVDSKKIGRWTVSAPWQLEKHSIVIAPAEDRANVSTIEFTFSQDQYRSLLFESITLSEMGFDKSG